MAWGKLCRSRRLLIKYFLVEEMGGEEFLFRMNGREGGGGAKKSLMFELKSEEGLFLKSFANHLHEDPNEGCLTTSF